MGRIMHHLFTVYINLHVYSDLHLHAIIYIVVMYIVVPFVCVVHISCGTTGSEGSVHENPIQL